MILVLWNVPRPCVCHFFTPEPAAYSWVHAAIAGGGGKGQEAFEPNPTCFFPEWLITQAQSGSLSISIELWLMWLHFNGNFHEPLWVKPDVALLFFFRKPRAHTTKWLKMALPRPIARAISVCTLINMVLPISTQSSQQSLSLDTGAPVHIVHYSTAASAAGI